MVQTAIYTQHDGVVDWRYCMTGNPEDNFEVPGTHIGMAFNAAAYAIVAERLAATHSENGFVKRSSNGNGGRSGNGAGFRSFRA